MIPSLGYLLLYHLLNHQYPRIILIRGEADKPTANKQRNPTELTNWEKNLGELKGTQTGMTSPNFKDAHEYSMKETDETTSTTDLEKKSEVKAFNKTTQSYLKAFIKLTRQQVKATHHLTVLRKTIKEHRPPRGLTPSIKHNIPKAPPSLIVQWNLALQETGEKLTNILIEYWENQVQEVSYEQERLKAELDERKELQEGQWEQIQEILDKVKNAVQEETSKRREQRDRPIKQASKFRLVATETTTTEAQASTSSTLAPKPQRENKKRDASQMSAALPTLADTSSVQTNQSF